MAKTLAQTKAKILAEYKRKNAKILAQHKKANARILAELNRRLKTIRRRGF